MTLPVQELILNILNYNHLHFNVNQLLNNYHVDKDASQ